jgi:hypothetical protein
VEDEGGVFEEFCEEGDEFEVAVFFVMEDDREGEEFPDFDTEFFSKFAAKGVFGRFIRFDFPAGEFPGEGEGFVGGTPGGEDFARGIAQDGADHGQRFLLFVHHEIGEGQEGG